MTRATGLLWKRSFFEVAKETKIFSVNKLPLRCLRGRRNGGVGGELPVVASGQAVKGNGISVVYVLGLSVTGFARL